jgi:excisionase family DNA binding protein
MIKALPIEAIEGPLMTVVEACRVLRCGRTQLYKLRNQGHIEMVKFGHRTTRVSKRSIEKYLSVIDRPEPLPSDNKGDAA